MFAIGVPVSGVIAGPMSSWTMTHMAGLAGLRGWQWLFLIEGAPAICLGVIAYFYLPDRPAAARFLSASEKMTIERDLEKEAGARAEAGGGSFGSAVRDPRTWGALIARPMSRMRIGPRCDRPRLRRRSLGPSSAGRSSEARERLGEEGTFALIQPRSQCVQRPVGTLAQGRFRLPSSRPAMTALCVRRDKAALSSGCKPHPATAPAGSNRSSHGGDEMAEAFGVAGHI